MRVYATIDEYLTFTGTTTAPEGLEQLLRRASRKIDRWLLAATYATDDEGMPTDPAVKAALRDATCAQAEWYDETGDTTGASARFNSLSLASFSVSGGGTGSGTNTTAAAALVSPDAVDILTASGLLGAQHRVL